MSLDQLISSYEREPVRAKYSTNPSPFASAYQALEELNASLPVSRRLFPDVVEYISFVENQNAPATFQAVVDLLATVENYNTNKPTKYTNLLPAGHPLGDPQPRAVVASYFVEEPNFNAQQEDIRALVAAAIAVEPGSAARKYYVTRLQMHKANVSAFQLIDDADAAVYVEEM